MCLAWVFTDFESRFQKKNVPVGNFRYDYACYVGEYMKFSFCKENFGEGYLDFSKNELFDSKV